MQKVLLLLFFTLNINVCNAQSLSGIWQCTTKPSIISFISLNSYKDVMELELSSDSLLNGIVHSYYSKGRYSHVKVSGIINWKDSLVVINDVELLDHNVNLKAYGYCYGIEHLKLTVSDGKYIMVGKWKDKSPDMLRCPSQKITWYKSIIDTIGSKAIDLILNRVTDIQDLIEIDSIEIDSIKCSIYDNGEIDDDTVSVFFDDSLIINKQRLSEKPIDFYLSIAKAQKNHVIKLYAENMGSIPPNTATMVITTRKNRYIINLASDFIKNGAIQLFFKE